MAKLKPGQPARGTKSGRPVMVALDLLGRRWTLRILWELRGTALSFRELQERCGGLSPTVLNQRLRELRDGDIIVHEKGAGYSLSEHGRSLSASLKPLIRWAEKWAERSTSSGGNSA